MSEGNLLICKVDKKGRVVCPTCKVKFHVPETHTLSIGMGACPNGFHKFLVDDIAVEAFRHFLSKQGGENAEDEKRLLKNHEEMPKDFKEKLTEGGIILPQ